MDDRSKTLAAVTIIVFVIIIIILIISWVVSKKKVVSPVPEPPAIQVIFLTPTMPPSKGILLPSITPVFTESEISPKDD